MRDSVSDSVNFSLRECRLHSARSGARPTGATTRRLAVMCTAIFTVMSTTMLALALPMHALGAQSATRTSPKPPARIVTLGPALTELVQQLGHGQTIVAADRLGAALLAPQSVTPLGSLRQVAPEAVLRQRPSLVLAALQVPAATRAQVRAAGTRLLELDDVVDTTTAWAQVRDVAAALGTPEAAPALIAGWRNALALTLAQPAPRRADGQPLRVLFVYARGAGATFVGGRGTAADALLAYAGAQNAVGVSGFRPLTAEAVVAARPDVILALADGVASVGGREGLLRLPGLAATPAGRAGRVVTLDDAHFSYFATRLPTAVAAVREALIAAMAAGGP